MHRPTLRNCTWVLLRGGGAGAKDSRIPATTTTADLFDIAAPMLQADGTPSGTIFAPDGIELYLDSVAMINAYEIYRWVPTMPCRAGGRWTDCDVSNHHPASAVRLGSGALPRTSGRTVSSPIISPGSSTLC